MLIAKDRFVGLDDVVHLATGGESPMLRSHYRAIEQFFEDKARGEDARHLLEATYARAKAKMAQLLSVSPEELCFLSSVSEGVNLLAHALEWQPGDNVIVADVEFPSDVLPWTRFAQQGVEVRLVKHKEWQIDLEEIAAHIDERTKVVNISYVSYFTGQRQNLPALSELVRASNALLLLDATHAAGAVQVDAKHADVLVSSCYKWLLGVHGAAVFYWNRARLPELTPPFLGWNTGISIPSWEAPTDYQLPSDADRFVAGNPSFISLYVLDNALDHLLQIGTDKIERHVLDLSEQVWQGLDAAGWQVLTPRDAHQRAGNICFVAPDVDAVTNGLKEQGVLVWGGYGGVNRIRVSTHLYNSAEDVNSLLQAMTQLA